MVLGLVMLFTNPEITRFDFALPKQDKMLEGRDQEIFSEKVCDQYHINQQTSNFRSIPDSFYRRFFPVFYPAATAGACEQI